jgi:hypothetical protein
MGEKPTALEGLEVQTVTSHKVVLAKILTNAFDIASVDILLVSMRDVGRRWRVSADVYLFLLGRHGCGCWSLESKIKKIDQIGEKN